MALGGGSFITQNKELPGAYINFISAASANAALSDRGIATMPLELDWGKEGEVFEVTNEDFQKNSMKIFGYAFDSPKMKGLSDLFLGAKTLYAYRLNGGDKAANTFATALYSGTRGNDLKIVIQANADDTTKFDVLTYMGTVKVDAQTVATAADLVANDYVTFKADATLAVTASTPLTGGTNGTVDGTAHQMYLDKIISVKNKTTDEDWPEASLVYWVTGAEAGCAVNKSCQNKIYDGSFAVATDFTQTQLKQCIRDGQFVLHRVNANIRVLEDINTMVTVTPTQGEVFKDNQTIRVIDQVGNDIAVLFNTKYLGAVLNNAGGRVSFWSDITAHHRKLEKIGAIEDFSESDVVVEPGEMKKSVAVSDIVTVANTMDKLYMTVTVS